MMTIYPPAQYDYSYCAGAFLWKTLLEMWKRFT